MRLLILALAALAVAVPVRAQTETFVATLSGAQVAPATGSTAGGAAVLTLSGTALTVSVTFSGLSSNNTTTHIHTAAAGQNGPVLFNVGTSGAPSGTFSSVTFTVTPAQIADLRAGRLYVDAHSTTFAGGEIRGQIGAAAPADVFSTTLSGTEVSPPTGSGATGQATVAVVGSFVVIATFNVSGLSSANTGTHIHTAAAGSNGPVTFNIGASGATTVTSRGLFFTATPAQIADLRAGRFYIDAHTANFPAGEVRGQLRVSLPEPLAGYSNDDVEFAFPLSPAAPAEVRAASSVGATADTDPQFRLPALGASCTASENDRSVWWYFRAATAGTATIDLAGSTFDTVLSVYDASTRAEVACNDDSATPQSRIADIAVTAGTYYYVRVSGFGSAAEGTVQIAMTSAAVTAPPQDTRFPPPQFGTFFARTGPRLGFNTGATQDAGETTAPASCASQPGVSSVWWSYVPASTGFLTIDLAGSTFDTVLLVTNQSGALLVCDDDNGSSLQSRIADFPVTANGVYFIRVASFGTATGAIRLNTSFSTTVAGEDGPTAAAGLALGAPRPNPSAGTTTLSFALVEAGPARLSVFDALGREVAVAFDGPAPAGETEVRVDVSGLPAGVYVARLVAGGRAEAQRLTVVR